MKKILAIVLTLTICLAFSSMALAENEPYNIGFVGMTLNNEFHIVLANAAKQEGEKLGVNCEVQAGAQHASSADQLAIVENYLSQGVDGILLVPSSSEGLISALLACQEANVPVVNLDTQLTQDVLDMIEMDIPFYGTNNYNGAMLQGEWVVENMPEGCQTAILTGIEGHTNAADRYNGFMDVAGEFVNVVATQSANWEVDQGFSAAQNIIQGNPELALIVCGNDNMAIGALRAVQEAELEDQITIIGFDAVSEALNLVKEGSLKATVAQYPAEMGIQGMQALVEILNGNEVPMMTDTGCEFVSMDNVDEFIEYVSQFTE